MGRELFILRHLETTDYLFCPDNIMFEMGEGGGKREPIYFLENAEGRISTLHAFIIFLN